MGGGWFPARFGAADQTDGTDRTDFATPSIALPGLARHPHLGLKPQAGEYPPFQGG